MVMGYSVFVIDLLNRLVNVCNSVYDSRPCLYLTDCKTRLTKVFSSASEPSCIPTIATLPHLYQTHTHWWGLRCVRTRLVWRGGVAEWGSSSVRAPTRTLSSVAFCLGSIPQRWSASIVDNLENFFILRG